MIVDMHCDTISRLLDTDIHLAKNDLHIDIDKLKKGNYILQNFAMFTPLKGVEDPMFYCMRMIDKYYEELALNSDDISPVFKYSDIEKNIKDNKISAMLTLEEGAVVNNDLGILRNYYRLGVRMITLTWNFANGIGHPNFDYNSDLDRYHKIRQLNTKDGLTDFGIAYLKEMERLGIIVDVSHLSDAGFYDVVKYSTKPFVASHSNARSVCDVARNLSDEMIELIAKKGGVIGLNYCEDFISNDGDGSINNLVKHALHIIKVGGIDVLGLGSDFDGIADRKDLNEASKLNDLVLAFKEAGLSDSDIAKITHENVLRVYKEVLV